jgi:dTDP-4-amino-4,6-dideoxygalactose transaminase
LDEEKQRVALVKHLNENGIEAMFHYIPLHNSSFGREVSQFKELPVTDEISAALLRLPLHGSMTSEDVNFIGIKIKTFYHG